jgi:hypothetical protein
VTGLGAGPFSPEDIEGSNEPNMPLIYRAMLRDGEYPKIGPTAKTLGVRIPDDIAEQGQFVFPGTGGMSVAPTWRALPMYRVPRRLKHLAAKAAGSNNYECWKMGVGPFEAGAVADGLSLRPDRPDHGLVEPSAAMPSEEYQKSLAATREQWRVDEETEA